MPYKTWMACAALSLPTACALATSSAIDPALKKNWHIVQFPHVSAQQIAELKGAMNFTQLPEVHAYFGCNHVHLNVKHAANKHIHIEPIMSTLKYCDQAMIMEDAFEQLATTIKRYTLKDNTLILHIEKGGDIHLHAAEESSPPQ